MAMRYATFIVALVLAGPGPIHIRRAATAGLADPVPLTPPSGFGFPLATVDMLKLRDITERDRAKAKQESADLVSAVQLSCHVTDAALIGHGKSNTDGKTIEVSAYEVACRSEER